MLYSCVCLRERERERERERGGQSAACYVIVSVFVCVSTENAAAAVECHAPNRIFLSFQSRTTSGAAAAVRHSLSLFHFLVASFIHSPVIRDDGSGGGDRGSFIILFLSSFQFLSAAAAASQPLNDIIIIIVFCEKNFLPLPVMFCFGDFELMRLFKFFLLCLINWSSTRVVFKFWPVTEVVWFFQLLWREANSKWYNVNDEVLLKIANRKNKTALSPLSLFVCYNYRTNCNKHNIFHLSSSSPLHLQPHTY